MKILIADDEPLARKRLLKLLREAEPLSEIESASSGKETIDLVYEFKPEILFLDIHIPFLLDWPDRVALDGHVRWPTM